MSFEYLADPAQGPQWRGLLPGHPAPCFLQNGEGEHAKLFGDLFTVLVSGAETDGQFGIIHCDAPAAGIIPSHSHAATHETFYVLSGKVRVYVAHPEGRKESLLEPGDFGFLPAGLAHAYRVEEDARMLGCSAGDSSGSSRRWARSPTPPPPASPRSSRA